MPAFNSAAHAIASHHTAGPVKTRAMCKTKWSSLKKIYNTIKTYRHRSGVHWNNEHGVNITCIADEKDWSNHTSKKGNEVLKPYHNTGWEYHQWISNIFPSGGAQGNNTFRPTTVPTALSIETISASADPVSQLSTLKRHNSFSDMPPPDSSSIATSDFVSVLVPAHGTLSVLSHPCKSS
ncbi:hypothetical protein J3R83DRAFT_7934 [Lanmaoa asiatica]|nr:hypothetical protein J3R83DRAFT_7934 [Lanmaoa asiatica]